MTTTDHASHSLVLQEEIHEDSKLESRMMKMNAMPMYDASLPPKVIDVPKSWKKYQLAPKYTQNVVFLDAGDLSFYEQRLEQPICHIWILLKADSFRPDVGYVKKRLVEEALLANVQVTLVAPHKFDLSVNAKGTKSMVYFGRELQVPHAVITRLGAACDYFGMAVLRQLQSLNVHIFNNASGVRVSRDKLRTAQVLAGAGIPIPRTVISMWPFDMAFIKKALGFPLICKRVAGARGEAVWKVDSKEELAELIDGLVERGKVRSEAQAKADADRIAAADHVEKEESDDEEDATNSQSQSASLDRPRITEWPSRPPVVSDRRPSAVVIASASESLEPVPVGVPASTVAPAIHDEHAHDEHMESDLYKSSFLKNPFIFQEFVASTKGRDLRVLVVGGKVIGAMMRVAAAGSFKANVHQGGSVVNVEVGDALRDISIETASLCHLDIAGVDLMMGTRSYVVCEVNSSPGFEGLEHATGINVASEMLTHVLNTCLTQKATKTTSAKRRVFPIQPEHV